MGTCPSAEQIAQLVTGQLDGPEHDSVAAHIEECPGCLERLQKLAADTNLTERLPRQSPADSRPAPPSERLTRLLESTHSAATLARPAPNPGTIQFPGPASDLGPLGGLGPYRMRRVLGGGAFGVVYEALDRLGRRVAVKILRPEFAVSAEERARFDREMRAAAAVKHDNLITIYQVGDTPEFPLPYFVMEYIEGVTLADRTPRASEGLPASKADEAARLVKQVAEGLAAAHGQGLVHRDVKPSNIMLETATGRAKITDFGLARPMESADQKITRAGSVVGTPAYMSPEHIVTPERVDARSDVYSLGVVLYELLTGRLPFQESGHGLLEKVVHAEPASPRTLDRALPRDLETIVLKCLEKGPERRYATAADLAADLGRFLAGEPIRGRRIGLLEKGRRWYRRNRGAVALAAAVLLVLAVGAAFWFFYWPAPERPADRPGAQLGDRTRIGEAGAWRKRRASTVFRDRLYTIEEGRLFETIPASGRRRAVGSSEHAGTRLLVADKNRLLALDADGSLYALDPQNNWQRQRLGAPGTWKDADDAVVAGDYLYTTAAQALMYVTDPGNGTSRTLMGAPFLGSRFLFTAKGRLFVLHQNGNLIRVSPDNAHQESLGQAGAWKATAVATIWRDRLFTAETDGSLVETDLDTGRRTPRAQAGFADIRLLFAATRGLFGITAEGSLVAIDAARGSRSVLGKAGAWKDASAGVVFNDRLITADTRGRVYTTDLTSGQWRALPTPRLDGIRFLFGVDTLLYAIDQTGDLIEIDPGTGMVRRVGRSGDWKTTVTGVVLSNQLVTIELNGVLWETKPKTGLYEAIGTPDYAAARFLVPTDTELYCIEADGSLYHIRLEDGERTRVGKAGAWKNTVAAAAVATQMYTVEKGGQLIVADLKTGERRQGGDVSLAGTQFLVAAGSKLHVVDSDGSLFAVSPPGRCVRLGQPGAWKHTHAAAGAPGKIFTLETEGDQSRLYETDLTGGQRKPLGSPDFADSLFLLRARDTLYTVERRGTLRQVDPTRGTWKTVDKIRLGLTTALATAVQGRLFTTERYRYVYRSRMADGVRDRAAVAYFGHTRFLFATENRLISIGVHGGLYEINLLDQGGRLVERGWIGTQAGTILNDRLYTVEAGGVLYESHLRSGARTQLGKADFSDTQLLFAAAGALYGINRDGDLYQIHLR
jgi:sugar lactone lactonase YvrE